MELTHFFVLDTKWITRPTYQFEQGRKKYDNVFILSCDLHSPIPTHGCMDIMNGEYRLLITFELVEFGKYLVELEDFIKL